MSDPARMAQFPLDHTHLQTLMFLQLAAGGHLLLFVVRTAGSIMSRPSPRHRLFLAIVATQVVAVLMCGYGILVPQLPWAAIAGVWLYVVAWMVVLDIVKLIYVRIQDAREPARPPSCAADRGGQATWTLARS